MTCAHCVHFIRTSDRMSNAEPCAKKTEIKYWFSEPCKDDYKEEIPFNSMKDFPYNHPDY